MVARLPGTEVPGYVVSVPNGTHSGARARATENTGTEAGATGASELAARVGPSGEGRGVRRRMPAWTPALHGRAAECIELELVSDSTSPLF